MSNNNKNFDNASKIVLNEKQSHVFDFSDDKDTITVWLDKDNTLRVYYQSAYGKSTPLKFKEMKLYKE